MTTPPITVLLAEDDADDRAFFSEFLKSRTDIHLLPAVENGEEVMRFLESRTALPGMIILDHNMPKRNGLQTLQALRQTPAFANIPVFLYSTYPDDRLTKQSLRLGALLVVPKPFTADGYHKMMDTFLEELG